MTIHFPSDYANKYIYHDQIFNVPKTIYETIVMLQQC